MIKPLISVIIPIYKVEEYLKECLDSVLIQTFQNLEIILVNDGSPDKCGMICDEYASQDIRIKVIHQEHKGLSDARNAGLDIAIGEFISFIDSDDYIHPEFLEILLKGIQENDVDISVCEYTREDFFFGKDSWKLMNFKEFYIDFPTRFTRIVSWNKLYKKSVWENLRYPSGRIQEDEFIHHILYYERVIAYTSNKLYYHRQRPGSITFSKTIKNWLDQLEGLKIREQFFIDKNEKTYLKKTRECIIQTQSQLFLKYDNPQAKIYLFKNLPLLIITKTVHYKSKVLIVMNMVSPVLTEELRKLRKRILGSRKI